ncbi:MAG: hypothetical protein H0U69_00610, partial [Trueperaceae bacterium]|nr:hypothetical protein [Trueperaceae bacterium]
MASAVLLLASVSAISIAQAEATSAATVIIPVSQSTDTAEEFLEASLADSERWPANYSYATSSDLELGFDPPHGPQLNAVRFTGLVVPDGSWVEHAEVVFTADGNSSGPLTLVVYGEASDAAEPFVQDPDRVGTGDLSSRPATAAVVEWSTDEPWRSGEQYATPDIAAIIQEIVDRPGWRSGAPIVVLIDGTGEETFRRALAYEGARGEPDRVPLLRVRFGGAATGADPAPVPETAPEPEPAPEPE